MVVLDAYKYSMQSNYLISSMGERKLRNLQILVKSKLYHLGNKSTIFMIL